MVMDHWLSIGGKDEEEKWFSTFMVESGSTTRGHDGKSLDGFAFFIMGECLGLR